MDRKGAWQRPNHPQPLRGDVRLLAAPMAIGAGEGYIDRWTRLHTRNTHSGGSLLTLTLLTLTHSRQAALGDSDAGGAAA